MITVLPPMYAEGYAPTMGDEVVAQFDNFEHERYCVAHGMAMRAYRLANKDKINEAWRERNRNKREKA